MEILRAMSGQERWKIANRLYWSARRLKASALRAQHPDWSEKQIEAGVTEIFANART
jgi:hypothetical protein